MKKLITYPKIQLFRNIVTTISNSATYIGEDENGEALFDESIKKPILTFHGTVKLHGSNASVCYNTKSGFWYQSRQKIITTEKDNAGFAAFAEGKKAVFKKLMDQIIEKYKIDTAVYTIGIYGEWAGKNVQNGVGISKLEKALYIFGVKISKPLDEDFMAYWIDSTDLRDTVNRVFNIEDFESYDVEVDFNKPQLAQDKFTEITEKVEQECPVAKAFGIENGLGEGVVWSVEYKDNIQRFKVKGEKHTVSKHKNRTKKTLAPIDVEKIASIKEFIAYTVTENRFNQGLKIVFENEDLDIKKMGVLLKWMVTDIASEESDTMEKNGLEPKDVNKHISLKTKDMFLKALNTF